jgi:tripartite ATP-independent transporter DctP family solute receptor
LYDMLHIICDMGRHVLVSFFNKVLRKHESGRRRTMKKLVAFILAVGLMFSLVGCGPKADSETLTLRFATDSSEDYVSTVQIYKFAEEVEEKTDGRIKVEVYAGAQLGDEKSCVEQVQMGSLDITKSSMGALTSFNENLTVLSMPYLFKSADHMWAVMDSDIGQSLLDSMEDSGLIGLGWLDAGSRCFYSTKPLQGPEDFKGLKVRVMQSSIYADMIKNLGGTPVSMPASDVYSALQTGVVHSAENNIPRIIDMSHNELCPYLILDRHNIMPEMVMISTATWGNLDASDQEIIKQCAANLQANMIAAWQETENAALKTLKDKGMTVVEPDADTIAAFREAMQPVYDKYGTDYADLIKQIENTKA